MNRVYVAADNIISPMGNTSAENFVSVKKGLSGILEISDTSISAQPFIASMFPSVFFKNGKEQFSRFEKVCAASITGALSQTGIQFQDAETLFILSTTKGNIEMIEGLPGLEPLRKRVSLFETAKILNSHFGGINKPLVVSHACISGVLSILIARRLLVSGRYRHAIITGADVLSRFIISGFQCLGAMSTKPCRPFDRDRDGINLGECASTIILTSDIGMIEGNRKIRVSGGASSNDANHISGPSRTGLELSYAIQSAMAESDVTADDLSFISAHGTATLHNDEMESKAFSHAGLAHVPVHSLKGNFGHTLGAAGVMESVLSCMSLREEVILPSKNFESSGVSENITLSTGLSNSIKPHALKTASGFGGSNAAIIYSIQ